MPTPLRHLAPVVAVVLLAALVACQPGGHRTTPVGVGVLSGHPVSPSPTPSVTTPAATPPPHITATPHVSLTLHITPTLRRKLPDLTIGLAGVNECTWFTDVDNEVWLNPTLEVFATGTVPSPVSFNMVSNWSKHTAGGGLVPHVAQTWAIDIGPAASLPALGHVVNLTATVDPTHEVTESNEGNNVTVIHVDLTGEASPPSGADEPSVPCS